MARGGYRPGSGPPKGTKYAPRGSRKPKAPKGIPKDIKDEAAAENLDPLTYMLRVMNDPTVEKDRRDRMAIAAAPFVHARKGEAGTGKKDEKAERAKAAGEGRFRPSAPPTLKVVGGENKP